MSSAPTRRSSYHLDVDRRLAAKQVQCHASERDQQQQEPSSPHAALKKTIIQEDEDAAENNNQEEVSSPRSVTRRVALRVSTAATAKVSSRLAAVNTTTAKATAANEKTPQLRKLTTATATLTNDSPRSMAAHLYQENAALKLQIVQLSNQHETQLQAVQALIVDTQSAHEKAEHALKNQITELEIQQAEATANAHTYRGQIESLTLQLRVLERQQEDAKRLESQEQQLPPTAPSSSPATPPERETVVKRLFAKRRGNGSPLPYGKATKNGSGGNVDVKPFAWRDHPADSTTNRYRMAHFSSSPVTPVTARYVSIVPPYPEQGSCTTHASVSELPSPFPEQQRALTTTTTTEKLVKTPSASASLLSYCSDMLSSKLTQAASTSPSPMKVMPTWKAEQQKQQQVWHHEKNTTAASTNGMAPMASKLPLPGDFTAITMPPMGFATTGAASASI